MARARIWDRLGLVQRQRYLSAGRKQGLTPSQTQAQYESGAPLQAWRGHGARPTRPGVTESQWRSLKRYAKASELGDSPNRPSGVSVRAYETVLLETMLQRGETVAQIRAWLIQQRESRTEFRSAPRRALRKRGIDAGWQPGRKRYYSGIAKHMMVPVDIFYYH